MFDKNVYPNGPLIISAEPLRRLDSWLAALDGRADVNPTQYDAPTSDKIVDVRYEHSSKSFRVLNGRWGIAGAAYLLRDVESSRLADTAYRLPTLPDDGQLAEDKLRELGFRVAERVEAIAEQLEIRELAEWRMISFAPQQASGGYRPTFRVSVDLELALLNALAASNLDAHILDDAPGAPVYYVNAPYAILAEELAKRAPVVPRADPLRASVQSPARNEAYLQMTRGQRCGADVSLNDQELALLHASVSGSLREDPDTLYEFGEAYEYVCEFESYGEPFPFAGDPSGAKVIHSLKAKLLQISPAAQSLLLDQFQKCGVSFEKSLWDETVV